MRSPADAILLRRGQKLGASYWNGCGSSYAIRWTVVIMDGVAGITPEAG